MIKIERQERRERERGEEERKEKKRAGRRMGAKNRKRNNERATTRGERFGGVRDGPGRSPCFFSFFFSPFSFFSFSFFFLFFIVTITDRHVQLYINEISNPPRCTTRTSAVGSTGTIILFEARVFYAAACQVVQSRRAKQRTGEHGLGKDRVHATLRGGTRPLLGHLPVRRLRVLHRESG